MTVIRRCALQPGLRIDIPTTERRIGDSWTALCFRILMFHACHQVVLVSRAVHIGDELRIK